MSENVFSSSVNITEVSVAKRWFMLWYSKTLEKKYQWPRFPSRSKFLTCFHDKFPPRPLDLGMKATASQKQTLRSGD